MITTPTDKRASEGLGSKLAATQILSGWTLRETDKRPSELFRSLEADLIGRLAHDAALAGLRFDGWPKVSLVHEYDRDFLRDTWRLNAEVVAK